MSSARRLLSGRGVVLGLALAGPVTPGGSTAQDTPAESEFQNLQVLPSDVSDDELTGWMLDNLRGLGLPRLEGRGCLHCHVGDLDQSRDQWDYAPDEKREKRIARRMMAMVKDINESHLAGLGGADGALEVTCYTCHAGRLDPRPLPDVLIAAYDEGGIDSLLERYEALRRRYYAVDAYDFRPGALSGVANTLARRGAFDDALVLSARNEAAFPDETAARRATLSLLVWRAVVTGGAEAAVVEFRKLLETEVSGALTVGLLDGLGWGLLRAGQRQTALALFEENRLAFPGAYVPFESLTDARLDSGLIDTAEAIRQYEEWLERFPTHQRARNRIVNLRSGDQ